MFAWRTATVRLLEPALGQSGIVSPVVALRLVETQRSALQLRFPLRREEIVSGVLHSHLNAADWEEGSRKVI